MGCQCFKAEEPIQVKASTFMDTDEKGEPNKVVYGFRPEGTCSSAFTLCE